MALNGDGALLVGDVLTCLNERDVGVSDLRRIAALELIDQTEIKARGFPLYCARDQIQRRTASEVTGR